MCCIAPDVKGREPNRPRGGFFVGIDMASKPSFKPWPAGTPVSWHYRSAVGHGTIAGVHKLGTSHDTTEYSIREHDHHVSASGSHEKPIVYHYGRALTRA